MIPHGIRSRTPGRWDWLWLMPVVVLFVVWIILKACGVWAAVTATPVFVQLPQLAAKEIISGTAQCTASLQPFSCCTGSGAGSGCDTTAASTDAAPTWDTIYTGGTNGSKVTALYVTSSDATAHVVTCAVNKNGIRNASVALTTGTTKPGYAAGVSDVDFITAANWPGLPVDSDGNLFVWLSNNTDKVECRYATALTASTQLNIVAMGADF